MIQRTILAAVIGLIIGSAAIAAQPRMQRSPQERADRLKEQLTLTDEQTTAVLEIFKTADKESAKLREENDGDRDAMMKAVQGRMEKTDTEIDKILTDEQKEQYKKIKEERRNRMQNRQRPG